MGGELSEEFAAVTSSFQNLQHLQHLNLSDTAISPGCLSNLSNLTYLDISSKSSRYADQSITALSSMVFLQHLDISHRQFNSIQPLSQLTSLTFLAAGHNQALRSQSLETIAVLTQLQCLLLPGVGSNWSCSTYFSCLYQLTSLTHLDLTGLPGERLQHALCPQQTASSSFPSGCQAASEGEGTAPRPGPQQTAPSSFPSGCQAAGEGAAPRSDPPAIVMAAPAGDEASNGLSVLAAAATAIMEGPGNSTKLPSATPSASSGQKGHSTASGGMEQKKGAAAFAGFFSERKSYQSQPAAHEAAAAPNKLCMFSMLGGSSSSRADGFKAAGAWQAVAAAGKGWATGAPGLLAPLDLGSGPGHPDAVKSAAKVLVAAASTGCFVGTGPRYTQPISRSVPTDPPAPPSTIAHPSVNTLAVPAPGARKLLLLSQLHVSGIGLMTSIIWDQLLRYHRTLRVLDISNSTATPAGLASLSALTTLTQLVMQNTFLPTAADVTARFADSDCGLLLHMQRMKHLDLRGNDVGMDNPFAPMGLHPLVQLRSLTCLVLAHESREAVVNELKRALGEDVVEVPAQYAEMRAGGKCRAACTCCPRLYEP